mmetsp:Transcript_114929/g.332109  ORF Transcript_114929/g.332109 Transcript_114929/m.332109 type:complete len:247 (-) Transcript_114929:395-1135(-)
MCSLSWPLVSASSMELCTANFDVTLPNSPVIHCRSFASSSRNSVSLCARSRQRPPHNSSVARRTTAFRSASAAGLWLRAADPQPRNAAPYSGSCCLGWSLCTLAESRDWSRRRSAPSWSESREGEVPLKAAGSTRATARSAAVTLCFSATMSSPSLRSSLGIKEELNLASSAANSWRLCSAELDNCCTCARKESEAMENSRRNASEQSDKSCFTEVVAEWTSRRSAAMLSDQFSALARAWPGDSRA